MTKFKELNVSNDKIDDADELRRRMKDEGYLFFRKLQDPDKLRSLRLDILEVMREGGWLKAGTKLADGIADLSHRCTEGDSQYTDVYHEVYKLESFHRAGHWPELLDMMKKIIGDNVFPYPHKIARLWCPPYTDHTTPAHQDFVHFQGNYETYTSWSPVGDSSIELGGLAILPGSHKQNTVFDHHFSLGAGALTVDPKEHSGDWVTTNYEIGDTLIFHCLTLHRALPNLTPDRLRISLDNRYQALGRPLTETMLEPHLHNFSEISWDEVYQDWKSDDLQYYWKDLDFPIIPKDFSFGDKGFAEALELTGQGDEHARYALSRLIKRDPTSDQAKAAQEVIKKYEANMTGTVN